MNNSLLKMGTKTLLFVISLISFNCFSQEHTVSGKVVDDLTKEALPFTSVCLVKKDSTNQKVACTETDLDGNFFISTDAHGEMVIKVEELEHKTYSEVINFENNVQLKKPIYLKSSYETIDGIEVIVTKKADFQKEIGSANRITKEELETKAPIGTGDALKEVPGIFLASDDGYGQSRLSVGLRGLNPRRSSRVLILEDGLPIQPAPYIYPNSYYNPPVERLDEIQIIKGSGTVKYGPQTMGGVINYVTTRPTEEFQGHIKVGFGNFNYGSIFADLNGIGSNKKFKSSIQLLGKRGDGFRDNNKFKQFNVTLKNLWKINDKRTLYTKINFNDEFSQATYTGLTDYTFERDPFYNPKDHDEFTVKRISADFILTTKHNENLTSTTGIYANHFKRDWWREDDVFIRPSFLSNYNKGFTVGYGGGNTELIPQTPQSNSTNKLIRVGNGKSNFGILRNFYVIGAEKKYTFKHTIKGRKAILLAGARVHNEIFKDDFKKGTSPTDRQGAWYTEEKRSDGSIYKKIISDNFSTAKSSTFETRAFSAFTEESINISEKLTVRAGLRAELFEQSQINKLTANTFYDKTSFALLPGLGFNYSLDSAQNWNMYGGIHRGYTAPSSGLFNLPFVAGSNSTVKLTPEYSWNNELGIRNNSKYFKTETAIFYNYITKMVTAGRSAVFLEPGTVSSAGLETATSVKLNKINKYLPRAFVNYTFLKTKIHKATTNDYLTKEIVNVANKELPYAPRHMFVVGLEEKLFKNKLSLMVEYLYTGQVYTDIQNVTTKDIKGTDLDGLGVAGEIDAYATWNASIKFKHKRYTFVLAGKNLLDQVYIASRLHSNPSRTAAGQSSGILVGARRLINGYITIKF